MSVRTWQEMQTSIADGPGSAARASRVPLGSVDDCDDEVAALLRRAYDDSL
jgi:hypothetical protein